MVGQDTVMFLKKDMSTKYRGWEKKKMIEQMLPNAHRVASLLKRWLIGTHQNYVSPHRLQNYLEEFVFRYNRRKSNSRGLLFQRVMEQAVKHNPVKYQ